MFDNTSYSQVYGAKHLPANITLKRIQHTQLDIVFHPVALKSVADFCYNVARILFFEMIYFLPFWINYIVAENIILHNI